MIGMILSLVTNLSANISSAIIIILVSEYAQFYIFENTMIQFPSFPYPPWIISET